MDKRIFAVLVILAVLMAGCAFASDSTGDNSVVISGLNFTVPDGYTEDVDEEVVNESGSDDNQNYVMSSKTFEKGDENLFLISVSTFEENMTDDYIKDLGEKATFGNVTGYIEDMGFLSIFSYIQDGKVVVITANDKSVIEEVFS